MLLGFVNQTSQLSFREDGGRNGTSELHQSRSSSNNFNAMVSASGPNASPRLVPLQLSDGLMQLVHCERHMGHRQWSLTPGGHPWSIAQSPLRPRSVSCGADKLH